MRVQHGDPVNFRATVINVGIRALWTMILEGPDLQSSRTLSEGSLTRMISAKRTFSLIITKMSFNIRGFSRGHVVGRHSVDYFTNE